jgi:predicted Rdx family selenoprotein
MACSYASDLLRFFKKNANSSCLIPLEKGKTRIVKNADGSWEEKRNNGQALPA